MAIKKELALAFSAWAFGISSMAYALPVLDTKNAAVRIDTSGKVMNISSTAPNNVIRWVDFSIAGGKSGEAVTFDKNNYLNYVTGHAVSEIFGTLTGGGDIYIINPNGILIGDGAKVNVGNLYLSTQKLDNEKLAAFTRDGTAPILTGANANGDVVNLGHLKATKVVVEGDVVKFKNIEDVKAQTINAFAKEETRAGYEAGAVDPAAYENLPMVSWYQLIMDETDLQKIELNKKINYMLAGNIEVAGDFTAIGTNSLADKKFLGHFDGLGYEIKLASVAANGKASGLFGAIGVGSVVENVTVTTKGIGNSTVASGDSVYIGGVVGYNDRGTVRNVRYAGGINAENICKYQYVGGIVGYNHGGTVENACNMGTISASKSSSAYVGGIVGFNRVYEYYNVDAKKNDFFEAAVKKSCNLGELASVAYVGGIAGGSQSGRLEDVYNTGAVSGKWAGGLIGKNKGKPMNKEETVFRAYHALGNITGTVASRGIVGVDEGDGGVFSKVFYSAATKNDTWNPVEDDKRIAVVKEDDGLKDAETFSGWSISNVGGTSATWRIYDGHSMPLLSAFLKPKDNIMIVEYDGTRDIGTYGIEDRKSVKVSNQLEGYDYVSDVTCVVPKKATGTTEPVNEKNLPDTKTPSEPETPSDTKSPPDTKSSSDTGVPSDTKNPSDKIKPPDSGNLPVAQNRPDTGELPGEASIAASSIGKEYEKEIAALQHIESEEQGAAPVTAENETETLVVTGSGVRLPDAMSAEELEEMLSGAEARENA